MKFSENRWVWVHNNRRRRTCHLIAGEAIKLIVNRRMGIHDNRRRHTSNIVVSREGAEDRVIDPVFREVQFTAYLVILLHSSAIQSFEKLLHNKCIGWHRRRHREKKW
ncbi:hypothetical protein TNCV_48161 [Trichonephila clavipes]|nr:hypothetical protein TNCV_48161 [Trichonephila clavipes]